MSESNDSQLDAACRILTVSSSLAGAKSFINRLKALSIQGQSRKLNSDADDSDVNSEENIVPWTIVNRYYIADVHFAAHVIHTISPTAFDKPDTPPAVIYVWVDGEPYAKHVEELSRMMGGYEPEVSLAVRIPKSDETAGLVEDNSETQKENNTDMDTILMSYGFEYIDATGEVPLRRGAEGNELPSADDIPHLPRVLDALSTIMWPSMKSGLAGNKRERESLLEELLAHDHGTTPSPASHRDSEDEDDFGEQTLRSEEWKAKDDRDVVKVSMEGSFQNMLDPWLTPDAIDSMLREAASPFGMEKQETATSTDKFGIGFEDDFTVFVSAPAEDYQECETTLDAKSYNKQHDTLESPLPPSVRYHSLGSVSDFGDEEAMSYESLDDGEENDGEDLPTEEEIRETSAKIFGVGLLPSLSEPFDLSQVVGGLEQMKSDISGIDNDEERRKAAAKVALGLAYGISF